MKINNFPGLGRRTGVEFYGTMGSAPHAAELKRVRQLVGASGGCICSPPTSGPYGESETACDGVGGSPRSRSDSVATLIQSKHEDA